MATLYGLTVVDPVQTTNNAVRLDNAFTALTAGTRYLLLGPQDRLYVKGNGGSGSITIAPTRDTVGNPEQQGAQEVPDLVASVTNGQIKRVPVQTGLYADERGIITCAVTGTCSVLVSRRGVEGQ